MINTEYFKNRAVFKGALTDSQTGGGAVITIPQREARYHDWNEFDSLDVVVSSPAADSIEIFNKQLKFNNGSWKLRFTGIEIDEFKEKVGAGRPVQVIAAQEDMLGPYKKVLNIIEKYLFTSAVFKTPIYQASTQYRITIPAIEGRVNGFKHDDKVNVMLVKLSDGRNIPLTKRSVFRTTLKEERDTDRYYFGIPRTRVKSKGYSSGDDVQVIVRKV